ncbi:MAG: nickel pincer cofactor biosynthesis protein LarC [Clostridia bacterium]
MKTLYIECAMGAAGDMLTAALLELMPDKEAALAKLNAMGIPGVVFEAEPSEKCGITGTHMRVLIHGEEEGAMPCGHTHAHHHEHDHAHAHVQEDAHCHDSDAHDHAHHHEHDAHHHAHHGMAEIRSLIAKLAVSETVKEKALAVYQSIAEAESKVHGAEVDQIHFHEVGSMDAVADVTAVCLLMELLAPEQVIVSPIHVGSGTVLCAHGRLPVPAPATALILEGMPIYGGSVQGELCTPTGAALLKTFADSFGPMPPMRVAKTGYGMGTKDFEQANCLRAMLGESFPMKGIGSKMQTVQDAEDENTGSRGAAGKDTETENPAGREGRITEISCNLDDMTGEDIAFAAERILQAGALDVFTESIYMKKGRPSVKLTVLARPEDEERLAGEIFRHTSTIGVRIHTDRRYELARRSEQRKTPLGTIEVKISEGFGVRKEKIEFASLKQIAETSGKSVAEVRAALAEEAKKE